MEIDPIAPVDEIRSSEEFLDRTVWKNKREILRAFGVSSRTLQRWREKEGLRMRKFKQKYWYHIKDAEKLYREKHKKEEKPSKMPISILWLAFWAAETIILFVRVNSYVKFFIMTIPLMIVVPA